MKVLIVAPHPDDETLGCGGTLLKHRAAGDTLYWVIMTQAQEPEWSAESIEAKAREIEKVSVAYGFGKTFRLGLPAARTDTLPLQDLITAVRDVTDQIRPDCVYVNHAGDIHSDHRVSFQAVMSAVKPFYSARNGVRRLLSYEVLSSTDAMPASLGLSFSPSVFSDISSHVERKLEIMALYETEVQAYPLPRASESIRALARTRGATVGVEHAEAFQLIREIS